MSIKLIFACFIQSITMLYIINEKLYNQSSKHNSWAHTNNCNMHIGQSISKMHDKETTN